MDETDAQLKELYDEIDEQDRQEREELKRLRSERACILFLLTEYGIPEKRGNAELSIIERLGIALRNKACA